MSMQDTMSDEVTSKSHQGLSSLFGKAQEFIKGLSGNENVTKATGWVKQNPKVATGVGIALGALLLNRLRRR
jgi:hypothetical protein